MNYRPILIFLGGLIGLGGIAVGAVVAIQLSQALDEVRAVRTSIAGVTQQVAQVRADAALLRVAMQATRDEALAAAREASQGAIAAVRAEAQRASVEALERLRAAVPADVQRSLRR